MNHRRALLSVVVVLTLVTMRVSIPPRLLAAPTGEHVRVVHFTFRNDTDSDISIRCGDQVMTVKARSSMGLALPAGATITAERAFAAYAVGEVLVRVVKDLAGNTVAVH